LTRLKIYLILRVNFTSFYARSDKRIEPLTYDSRGVTYSSRKKETVDYTSALFYCPKVAECRVPYVHGSFSLCARLCRACSSSFLASLPRGATGALRRGIPPTPVVRTNRGRRCYRCLPHPPPSIGCEAIARRPCSIHCVDLGHRATRILGAEGCTSPPGKERNCWKQINRGHSPARVEQGRG